MAKDRGFDPGVMISFRSDEKDNLIRAFIARTDGKDRKEIGQICMSLCTATPGLFEKFKDCMSFALIQACIRAGMTVERMDEVRPKDKN